MYKHLTIIFAVIGALPSMVCYAQQPTPVKPDQLPAPFETFQDAKQFNAGRVGPGNTISFVQTPPDFRLSEFAISPDSRLLAMGWGSGRIEIWDIHTKHRVSEFQSGIGEPGVLRFNPAGAQLVVSGSGGKVNFLEVPSGKKLRGFVIPLGKYHYDLQQLLFDPQAKWMAYADEESSKVLDLTTDSLGQLADLKDAGSIALSSDGSKLFTVNRTELVGFNTANWEVVGRWPLKSPPINTQPVLVRTGVTADGKGSVVVPSGKGLVIYREPEMIGDYVTEKPTSAVGFSRSHKVYINLSGEITFLTAEGKVLCKKSQTRYGYAVSEDGDWLAISQFGSVNLWRMDDLLANCKAQE
jgi:WD40 repeat protein